MSSAGLPGRSGVGARRCTERGWGAIPQPARRRPTRPGNRRARAFPSIVRLRGGSVQRHAPPGRMPAHGMLRPVFDPLPPLRRGRLSRAQTNPKLPVIRANPSRTRMRTNPAASEPERTQAGREVPNPDALIPRTQAARTGPDLQPLASERTRAEVEFDRTRNPNEPKPVESRPSPGALETERTQAARTGPDFAASATRTNPSGR